METGALDDTEVIDTVGELDPEIPGLDVGADIGILDELVVGDTVGIFDEK